MDDRFKRRLPGTNKLPPREAKSPGAGGMPPQDQPLTVRLDPNSKPGEFNFVIDAPQELTARVSASGLMAEATGGIPPQLHAAVDQVLGFIYELDQQVERKGKRR